MVMTFGSAAVDPNSAASYGSISLWDKRNDELLARRSPANPDTASIASAPGRIGDALAPGN